MAAADNGRASSGFRLFAIQNSPRGTGVVPQQLRPLLAGQRPDLSRYPAIRVRRELDARPSPVPYGLGGRREAMDGGFGEAQAAALPGDDAPAAATDVSESPRCPRAR